MDGLADSDSLVPPPSLPPFGMFGTPGFPRSQRYSKTFGRIFLPFPLRQATPETAVVGRIDHGEWVGGEGLFVPSKPDGLGDEDDGFLVTFVSPKDGGTSGTY